MWFLKEKKVPLHEFLPNGFVDIHSHVLPGIDDGAKDMKQSLEMLNFFEELGIKNIITTPHILGDLYPNTPEIIREKEEMLHAALGDTNHSIHFKAAAEYMLDEVFQKLLESKSPLLTLKGKYVMIEMSYIQPPINLYDLIFELKIQGYQPILAHPERYVFYHQDKKSYEKLKKAGCWFQLNLLSVSGRYGKAIEKVALQLLEQGLIDFVGTDAHSIHDLQHLHQMATKKNLKRLEGVMERNVRFFSD